MKYWHPLHIYLHLELTDIQKERKIGTQNIFFGHLTHFIITNEKSSHVLDGRNIGVIGVIYFTLDYTCNSIIFKYTNIIGK